MSDAIKFRLTADGRPLIQDTVSAANFRKLGKIGDVVTLKMVEEKRSLQQNDLSHAWYAELDKNFFLDERRGHARNYCKLHFGVPILRQEDAVFRDLYDKSIKPVLSYEEKIAAMKILPVTSRMSRPQKNEYLTIMQQYFAEQSFVLSVPKDDEYLSWSKLG